MINALHKSKFSYTHQKIQQNFSEKDLIIEIHKNNFLENLTQPKSFALKPSSVSTVYTCAWAVITIFVA